MLLHDSLMVPQLTCTVKFEVVHSRLFLSLFLSQGVSWLPLRGAGHVRCGCWVWLGRGLVPHCPFTDHSFIPIDLLMVSVRVRAQMLNQHIYFLQPIVGIFSVERLLSYSQLYVVRVYICSL